VSERIEQALTLLDIVKTLIGDEYAHALGNPGRQEWLKNSLEDIFRAQADIKEAMLHEVLYMKDEK